MFSNCMDCIHKLLNDPSILVNHHISSFNHFIERIPSIIKQQNPLIIFKKLVGDEFKHECNMYVGGKQGNEILMGRPFFYENTQKKVMYPNDARLRNLTYAFSISAKLTFVIKIEGIVSEEFTTDYVFLGNFPIMLQSNMCVLQNMPDPVRFNMGECSRDPGGYFIVDGSEKVIVCQENRANNTICVLKKYSDAFYYRAEIKSESEDDSKLARVTGVQIATREDPLAVKDRDGVSLHEIVVDLPDVRVPIPLFIVMRAFGILSDKKIIDMCLLGECMHLVDHFRESIYDAGSIYTQESALEYIGYFTKYQTVDYALRILSELTLPHIGETNFIDKAYFLGLMVSKLLRVATHIDAPTDRDSFMYKRINTTGMLLTNLFRDFYAKQLKHVNLSIDRTYAQNIQLYDDPAVFSQLFKMNYETFFEERIAEDGFIKAFKGDWGAAEYSKREGVSQKLNRLSYSSAITHLRKCVMQLDDSAKVVAPHLLNASQWGVFDPVDTPDGGDIGTHKHLSLCSRITEGFPKQIILDVLSTLDIPIYLVEHTPLVNLSIYVKLFINGHWHGSVDQPDVLVKKLISYRRHGKIPVSTSISWNIQQNSIYIYTDAGRVQRPLFYVQDGTVSYVPNDLTWEDMVQGTEKRACILEYVDSDELNTSLVSFNKDTDFSKTTYTHAELHGSAMFGFMGNHIIFPQHSPLPRNCFSCSQSKQAVSVYNTNYQNRMDTMGVVLNYGQMPLVHSSYVPAFKTLPYGVNAIVAIMCYTGYNTEDAILVNKAALDRGMFNTSYFKTYEEEETTSMSSDSVLAFEGGNNTDENGIVKVNTQVTADTVLMRMVQNGRVKNIFPNADQVGRVDKTFISEGEPGRRVAKVRICTERIPNLGDKFASRAGQKGTCGLILREEDMPFTASGIRPDLIINPHAIPSRMTLGQLIECIMGKIHTENGGFGDCTVFNRNITEEYRTQLVQVLNSIGYHSSGCEVLYNGMTGDQLQSDIFIGPTYYMRLKHMVSDKINFRPRGPNAALTRQPLQGRSNEGGLRIGEMERDGLIGNGMSQFVRESMMTRGDGTVMIHNSRRPYHIHVDDSSGLIAAYNEDSKIAISPSIDGVEFDGDTLNTIPKTQKTFSRLNVPYCFKLLMQELITMNVQMRLITSSQVDHRSTMKLTSVVKQVISLFSRLGLDKYTKVDNLLYNSMVQNGTLDLVFQHTNLLNTIFPFLSEPREFEKLRLACRTITPQPYASKYHADRCALPIYKPSPDAMDRTLSYMLNKMKTGVFVRIRNNKVFNFNPLYNVDYTNDFYTKISPESVKEMFEVLKKGNPGKFRNSSKDPSKWTATDCLLRTEKVDNAPTDAYLADMYDMLVETCSHRKVNDCIFFITRKDFPHLRKDWKEAFTSLYGMDTALDATYENKSFIPIVSQSTTVNHADLTMPTGDDWKSICREKFFASTKYDYGKNTAETKFENGSTPRTNLPLWEKREPVFFWRGQGTGCGNDASTNPRMKLNELSDTIKGLDARIMRYTERIKARIEEGVIYVDYKPTVDVKKYAVPMEKQLQNKFIINVEGNSAAYRFGSLLGLGFCVINVQSKYTLWFEPMMNMYPVDHVNIEEAHCILVQHDLSDLEKTIQWCLANDAICERIKNNAMTFYDTHFTREFVYDYMADLCNSISNQLTEQPDTYKEVQAVVPKKTLKTESFRQPNETPRNGSVIVVPYRDGGNQNRAEQLDAFVRHYQDENVLVVEQMDGEKFNRGILLNIGYDYLVKNLPDVNTFLFHDVDIVMNKEIIEKYYGYDEKPMVHLGNMIKGDKYSNSTNFLGRVLKTNKETYKKLNGFPNTFYGWGGEDDAFANRIHATGEVVYRPAERNAGYEMETKNDIFLDKDSEEREKHKLEELVSDTIMWKINGLNSLQYTIVNVESLGKNARKITVQLSPYTMEVQGKLPPVKKEVPPENDELEVLEPPEEEEIKEDIKEIKIDPKSFS